MAVTVVCDMCGEPIDPTAVFERGFVLKCQYDLTCAHKIDKMLQEIDDLHDKLVDIWEKNRKKIHKKYSKGGGKLPDVSA